jgi:hypothetical protein
MSILYKCLAQTHIAAKAFKRTTEKLFKLKGRPSN